MENNKTNIEEFNTNTAFVVDNNINRELIAYMWSDVNYTGSQYYVMYTDLPATLPMAIKSLKVFNNRALMVYELPNYGGVANTYKGYNPSITPTVVRSLKVFPS